MDRSQFPLHGVRVVAFEQAAAAPLATRHLADMGADVIKVERRGEGDFARTYDSAIYGTSTWFVWLNRNKRSISLDLKTEEGIMIARKLVDGADVMVQNFAAGAFDRLGLGAEDIRARDPSKIVVSITGYGEEGPYRDRKAYDLLVQAEAGVLSVTGTPEHEAKVGVSLVDFSTGTYAFGSIMTALYRKQATGEGATIRISLFDCMVDWMTQGTLLANYGTPPERVGAFHATIVPYGPYKVGGGKTMMLSVQNPREWSRFCAEVLERPQLIDDPRFENNEKRLRNRTELEPLVEEALSHFSIEEAEERMEKASLPYSRDNNIRDVLHHPQLEARDRLLEVNVAGGSVKIPRSPLNIDGLEEPPGVVPSLGQHTDEILGELGYDTDAIARLHQNEVV